MSHVWIVEIKYMRTWEYSDTCLTREEARARARYLRQWDEVVRIRKYVASA